MGATSKCKCSLYKIAHKPNRVQIRSLSSNQIHFFGLTSASATLAANDCLRYHRAAIVSFAHLHRQLYVQQQLLRVACGFERDGRDQLSLGLSCLVDVTRREAVRASIRTSDMHPSTFQYLSFASCFSLASLIRCQALEQWLTKRK